MPTKRKEHDTCNVFLVTHKKADISNGDPRPGIGAGAGKSHMPTPHKYTNLQPPGRASDHSREPAVESFRHTEPVSCIWPLPGATFWFSNARNDRPIAEFGAIDCARICIHEFIAKIYTGSQLNSIDRRAIREQNPFVLAGRSGREEVSCVFRARIADRASELFIALPTPRRQ